MNSKRTVIFLLLFAGFVNRSFSQCTTLGQTPPTAFPVCGTQTFIQDSVPLCGNSNLFVPGCTDGALYSDKNPFWYKFTCYLSGTLGFVITPNAPNDDYDWQLYDVTGLDPNAVFSNQNIIVSGNWAGTYAPTGASASGVNYIHCSSDPADNKPTFAQMPNLIVGHNYLLMISHYTDTQNGYTLAFGGGTAVITDPLEPHLKNATAPCDGTEIRIATNKKMKCNSLAADGSDFKVVTSTGTVLNPISASSLQCSAGFDLDTLSIFLSAPLSTGTYTVVAKKGTDGNTLKDNCDREIPVDEQVQFTVFPLFPTPLDSLTKLKCAPQTLELVFKKRIKCSSIDAGGGDFNITGPYPVSITGATANCVNGEATKIILQLSAPLLVSGDFFVNLQVGPDGNTIIDECDMETPIPSKVGFWAYDTVNANFNYSIAYSCTKNMVSYFHNAANGVNSWYWSFDMIRESFVRNPIITYTNFEPKETTLIVSNGVCSDTAASIIVFDNYLKADFDVTPLVCPSDKAVFTNKTIGTITAYKFAIGNGNIITVKDPAPQVYAPLDAADYYAYPELIVTNNFGCSDTIKKSVQVVNTCFIAVPSAFTPNGDGINDFLYPLKAYKSTNLTFSIFNRFGQRVFYTTSWLNKWDGKVKGLPQDPGTYVWVLDYVNSETGKHVFQKGTSILIR